MNHTDRDPWLGGAHPAAPQDAAELKQPVSESIPDAPGVPAVAAPVPEPVAAPEKLSLKEMVSAAPAGELWRSFIAIELSEAVRVAISGLRHLVPRASFDVVRWVHPDTMHITLRFLGDAEPSKLLAISQELAGAASRSSKLTLRAGAPGAFPDTRAPRALWVGFEGDTQHLVQLQGRVEGVLAKLEIEPDRQKFTPHVTAGRLNNEVPGFVASQTGQAWVALKLPPELPQFTVGSVVLFRSHLDRLGARYEKLSEAPFG
ncbi:MAG: RNA 2',3'-cyclic phosphodiesterase [Dehalococcoidia bacterium]|nr:RNA 2',3'-cyclic phosphodiesterase [Dehalococcoidia bacterium]MSQ34339.1 RNA 2',3'-cyclic phosphodiesterase [Dehalococcoidia bacterium]